MTSDPTRTAPSAFARHLGLALALTAFAALAAFALPAHAETVVQGSNRSATVQRALPLLPDGTAPDAVAVSGTLSVELVQGNTTGITLSGDDNVLPSVETRLQGRSLHIGPREGHDLRTLRPVHVRVVLPALSTLALGGSTRTEAAGWRTTRLSVALGGSCTASLDRLEATRLEVNIGGSGRVDATGRAGSLDVTIGGSGQARLGDLAVDEARVTVAGSGSAEVAAANTLATTIAGSGTVLQRGAAEPRSTIIGSGRVVRR